MCNRNKIEELWTTPMPLSPDQRLTESMPQCRCRPLAALRQGRSSGQFCGGRHIPLLAAHRENLWSWSLHRHQIHWRLHSGKTCGHGLRPDTRYNMKAENISISSNLSHASIVTSVEKSSLQGTQDDEYNVAHSFFQTNVRVFRDWCLH